MGNSQTKGQIKGRQKKQVHWKSAERPGPPGKPQLVPGAEITPDVVTIRWDKPKSDGGSPITGYLVEHRRTGSPHWVRATPLLVVVPELALSGLEPGWRYQFRITAQNVVGMSDPGEISEPLTVTLQRSVITAPKFTEELHDTTALENEMTEFVVHVIGQPPPKICWFKDGFEIFSSRRTRIITENDKSVLTIHQVSLSDEGEIKCTATNKAGHVSTRGMVKVEAPPVIRLPRQYEDGLLFELDEVIRLKVSIAGRPQPLVFWSHNGETIQTNDRYEIMESDKSSVLKVGEAKRTDRGEYLIRAVNKLGEDSTSFLVTVTDKPQPPRYLKVIMSLGKTVTLSWELPEDDGGCKIGNYIVEYYRIGWNVWLKAATCRHLTTTLSDLIEGSEYKFRVKAESPYGVSDPSDETDVIFIPDPKRGLLAPPPRTKSLTRESQRDRETSPVPPKRRSTSSTRNAQREQSTLILPNTIPTPPKREKIKSPQRSPESSPMAARKYLTGDRNMFDRSSLTRELSYGSPDKKYKKPEVKPQFLEPKPITPIRTPPENKTPIRTPPENNTPIRTPPENKTPIRTPPENQTPIRTPPENKIPSRTPPENKTPSPVIQRERSPSIFNQFFSNLNPNPPENKTPSPVIQRERSPSIINTLLSNILPSKKTPTPTPTPSPSPSPPKENKTPSPIIQHKEEIVPISSMKGDRLDRLSPNITARRLSSPMVLDREKSPSPFDGRNRSPSLVESLLGNNKSPANLSPTERSKSPSPNLAPNRSPNRSPSPSRYSISNDDGSRRGSMQSPRNDDEMVHGSSEFMLVLVDDQDDASQEYFMFENSLIAPPMSLSAPELGAESELFMPLKTSVSSTELLHERAFARFMKDAEESRRQVSRRNSFEVHQKITDTDERRQSIVPKILINSKDNEDIVGLERSSSFTRRLSAGAANIAQQFMWAKRRQSLRNTITDNSDLYDIKSKFSDKLKDISRERSISEEMDEEEFTKVENKMASNGNNNIRSSPNKREENRRNTQQESFEESIYSEEESESEDERSKADLYPPNVQAQEEETYHPRRMITSAPSKYEEPFEILTKPTALPDPNFIPKPILKRKEEKKKDRSLSPLPMKNRLDRSRTPSPAPEKLKQLSPIPSPVPGRRVSEAQMISAAEAAKNKRIHRQSSEEEYKVVAEHYMDLVREYGGPHKPAINTYLNREDWRAPADEEEPKTIAAPPLQVKQEPFPVKKEPPPVKKEPPPVKKEPSPVRTTVTKETSPIRTRRETGRSTSRNRNTRKTRNTSNTRSTSNTRNSSSTRATKRNPSPCPPRRQLPENAATSRPLVTPENKITPATKPKARSRSTSRTRQAAASRTETPPSLQEKLMMISRTPSPRPLTPEQEAMQAEAEMKVRSTVDYMTDVAMFIVACWLYLFKDARLAIPILVIMVYRQLKDEVKNMMPGWLTKRKKQ